MPMQLHEPTSELHKRAEELAYASLLNDVSLTLLIHPLLLFLYLGVFLSQEGSSLTASRLRVHLLIFQQLA